MLSQIIGHFLQSRRNTQFCAIPFALSDNILFFIGFAAPHNLSFDQAYANFKEFECMILSVDINEPSFAFDLSKINISSSSQHPATIVDFYFLARKHPHSEYTQKSDDLIFHNYLSHAISSFTTLTHQIQFVKKLQHPLLHFILDDLCQKEAVSRLHNAKAKIIQHHFKIAISNPHFVLCQNRLRFEFSQLSSLYQGVIEGY